MINKLFPKRIMLPALAVTGVGLALTFGGSYASASEIVPCGGDAECAFLNPGVGGYGVDKPIGEYDVPGGTLTVLADASAYFQPDENVILGHCEFDDTNAETGEWHEPIWACVPMYAPDGTRATMAFPDDGSGAYGESPWGFDAELDRFTR